MSGTHDITETKIAFITKDANEIVAISMKNCVLVDEYDVMDYNLVIRWKGDNKPVLKLVIAAAKWELSRKARRMMKKENAVIKPKAIAIVLSNRLKVSFLNLIEYFKNKTYPKRFFTSRDEAYTWLLKHK